MKLTFTSAIRKGFTLHNCATLNGEGKFPSFPDRSVEKFSLPKKYFVKSALVFSLLKTILSRNFCQKCVKLNKSHQFSYCVTVWKLLNFTATLISQNFCQINVLLANFTVIWFDEKIISRQWIFRFSTLCVWKNEKFSTKKSFFRQIKLQYNSLVNR